MKKILDIVLEPEFINILVNVVVGDQVWGRTKNGSWIYGVLQEIIKRQGKKPIYKIEVRKNKYIWVHYVDWGGKKYVKAKNESYKPELENEFYAG